MLGHGCRFNDVICIEIVILISLNCEWLYFVSFLNLNELSYYLLPLCFNFIFTKVIFNIVSNFLITRKWKLLCILIKYELYHFQTENY